MKVKCILLLFLALTCNLNSQTDFDLDKVLQQLNLKKEQCKTELITSKRLPYSKNETVVVIPEIIEDNGSEILFNSHILIIDSVSNQIKNKYFESSETNEWDSNAVILSYIEIDTAKYYITKNKRAFGIRLIFYTLSKMNPYSLETISLFVSKGNTLSKILNKYTAKEYVGEINMDCDYWSIKENKYFSISKNRSNNFFDIIVTNEISESESFQNEKNDECDEKVKKSIIRSILKFNGTEYK
ncbi:hypothetical protein [uncultured Tenacibaculum sp.]|uniref:hypothetical protein n=1 Tax=uncultured Tenacibaculum sp. TaxID=174713 RepID=UPI002634DC30|nr:hypothetical protein [uncultured Tenacibaculum sp.]